MTAQNVTREQMHQHFTTAEVGLSWAIDYHENKAKMNAANAAATTVQYPPIVAELHEALNAVRAIRASFEEAERIADGIVKSFREKLSRGPLLDEFAKYPTNGHLAY